MKTEQEIREQIKEFQNDKRIWKEPPYPLSDEADKQEKLRHNNNLRIESLLWVLDETEFKNERCFNCFQEIKNTPIYEDEDDKPKSRFFGLFMRK